MLSHVRAITNVLIGDLLGSVFRFPLWWYSEGLLGVVRWAARSLSYRFRGYAISLWVRNLFVPMYGTRDWAGRLISLVMRIVVILARSLAFMVEAIVYLSLILAWFFAPVGCLIALLLNVSTGLEHWKSLLQ